MVLRRRFATAVLALMASIGAIPSHRQAISGGPDWTVDHRYAPIWWQTSICLPDDGQKTLVGREGTLLYDYRGKYSDFKTRIGLSLGPEAKWVRQELAGPRVPIVRTVTKR